jgi:hypothetical protein
MRSRSAIPLAGFQLGRMWSSGLFQESIFRSTTEEYLLLVWNLDYIFPSCSDEIPGPNCGLEITTV